MTYCPSLVAESRIGESIAERNALLNASRHIWVFKEYDESGRMFWRALHGTSSHFPGGFECARGKTRRDVLAHVQDRYPNLGLTYEHGDNWIESHGISAKLQAAIHAAKPLRKAMQ